MEWHVTRAWHGWRRKEGGARHGGGEGEEKDGQPWRTSTE